MPAKVMGKGVATKSNAPIDLAVAVHQFRRRRRTQPSAQHTGIRNCNYRWPEQLAKAGHARRRGDGTSWRWFSSRGRLTITRNDSGKSNGYRWTWPRWFNRHIPTSSLLRSCAFSRSPFEMLGFPFVRITDTCALACLCPGRFRITDVVKDVLRRGCTRSSENCDAYESKCYVRNAPKSGQSTN